MPAVSWSRSPVVAAIRSDTQRARKDTYSLEHCILPSRDVPTGARFGRCGGLRGIVVGVVMTVERNAER